MADPQNLIVEDDTDPLNEDNTAVLSGVYHSAGGDILVQGGLGDDSVSLANGDVQVTLNANTYSFTSGDVSRIRVRTHDGNDTINIGNVARPIAVWSGSGDDSFGVNASSVNAALLGGVGNDTFKFADGASIVGSVDGGDGSNTIDESAYSTAINVNIPTATITGVGTPFLNLQSFIGSASAPSTLTGPAVGSTYNVSSPNAGTIGGYSFSNFGVLIAGGGNDTFKFGVGATISGMIDGGGGTNTIDATAVTTPVAVNLDNATMSGLGGMFANIQNINGGSAANTLTGPATGAIYTITGGSAGNVAGFNFTKFGSITGGYGDDTFKFKAGASLSGTLDGLGGVNTIDQSLFTSNINANLTAMTLTGLGATFANIAALIAGTGANALTGPAAGSIFNVTGNNAGSINGVVSFVNYGALIGGAGNDVFKFNNGASITGTVYGGGGSNTIDDSALTTNLAVNLASSTISGVGTTFSKVQSIVGGAGSSTLMGPAAGSVFNITGTNVGNVAGIAFSKFGSLVGSAGNDIFVFANGATLSGTLDGGTGVNTLDDNAYVTPITVNLASGTSTGIGTTITNIENVRGGQGNDTITGGSIGGVLIGGPGDDILTGGPGRTILIGGSGSDMIIGGSNDDIVIGGTTSYDGNFAALDTILAEWQSSDSYSNRVSLIKNGGGLNGSNKLIWTLTVLDDNAVDSLLGNAGTDWFFEATNDSSDNQPNEQID